MGVSSSETLGTSMTEAEHWSAMKLVLEVLCKPEESKPAGSRTIPVYNFNLILFMPFKKCQGWWDTVKINSIGYFLNL